MHFIRVQLEDEEHAELKKLAAQARRTPHNFVRRLLTVYIEELSKPKEAIATDRDPGVWPGSMTVKMNKALF